MTVHVRLVSQLVPGCFYQLSRIKTIRRFTSTSAAVILVDSFIFYRFDYCNCTLADLQTCQLDRNQSVLSSAAHFIYGRTPSDHTTDLLPDNLHWLRVLPLQIAFKLCLITYKTLNDRRMSNYISNFCSRHKATILIEKSSTSPTVFCEVCATVPSLLQEY